MYKGKLRGLPWRLNFEKRSLKYYNTEFVS